MKNKKLWLGMLAMVLVFGIMVVGCNNDDDNGYNCSACRDGTRFNHDWKSFTYVVDFQIINDSTLEVLMEGALEARNDGQSWSDTSIRRDIRLQLGFVDSWGNATDTRTVAGIDQRLLILGITETSVCSNCGR